MEAFAPITARDGRATWQLHLSPSVLSFEREGSGERRLVPRGETAGVLEWFGLTEVSPFLIAYLPKRRVLKLSGVEADRLREWLGAPGPQHLKASIQWHTKWLIAIGASLILLSFPTGAESSWNWTSVALGAFCIGETIVGRVRPGAWFYRAQIALSLLVVAEALFDIVRGKDSPLWILWILWVLALIPYWRKLARFYEGVKAPT